MEKADNTNNISKHLPDIFDDLSVSNPSGKPAPTEDSAGRPSMVSHRPSASEEGHRARASSEASGGSADARKSHTINYEARREIGRGSFGSVYLARKVETGETVAIKKVLQDRRFKNRELSIMRLLAQKPHPYIVCLKHHFISSGSKEGDVYLNLVLDYVPETIHSVVKYYNRMKEVVPIFSVKIFMYQLARALAHIHGIGICHRDIKPQNLLVNPARHILKLCDFGSAKALVPNEPNVAYICSRYYRAPELIFGAQDYSVAIDVWSYGCVVAELLLGTPIFPGPTAVDQLVEIVRVMGTPTKDEIMSMNPKYQEQNKFPSVKAPSWPSVFKSGTNSEAIDLVSKLLVYYPKRRYKAIEACSHNFFDELRDPQTKFREEYHAENLFIFTKEELELNPEMGNVLVPEHYRNLQAKASKEAREEEEK